MSLQVWLPFNGDSHNQGLAEISITNNSTTINNNGKIGKCLHFSNTEYITMTPGFLPETGKEFSCCYWVKELSNNTVTNFRVVYECGQLIIGQYGNKFNVWQTNSGIDIMAVIDSTMWVHCCVTVDATGLCKIYTNGQYQTQKTISTYPSTGTTTIGRRTIGGTNANSDFLINDFRIYDHALSAKEVEEISKGLVLHYKLDNNGMGNPNILTGTYYNSYNSSVNTTVATNASGKWCGGSGGNGTFSVVEDTTCPVGHLSWNINNNTSGNRDFQQGNEPYISGQQYTTSFWAKGNGTCLYRSWNTTDSKAMFSKTWALTSNWTYYTYTFTASAEMETDTCTFHLGVTGAANISICGMKMELGGKATNYCPALNEINNNIIYDSSGYNNNGTIVGSLEIITSSQKYSCAIKMANGQYIRVNNRPNACMPKDAITVNLWQYATSWGGPISCTESGGWNFENSNGIRFPVYISGVGYKIAQSSITPASTQNAWHMLTGTMDKDNIKIYYDGEEVGTVANGSTNGIGYANNYIFIGAEAGGNSTSPASSAYTGNLSDIRIYATALTADQIKELYNTSSTIDKNGNIYAREQIENLSDINVTKTGQLQSNKIVDDNTITIANFKKSDKSINGNTIYEY